MTQDENEVKEALEDMQCPLNFGISGKHSNYKTPAQKCVRVGIA